MQIIKFEAIKKNTFLTTPCLFEDNGPCYPSSNYFQLMFNALLWFNNSFTFFFIDIPIVTLELGSNIISSSIREGVDVYFECNIKSNPWVYRVSWRHNVSIPVFSLPDSMKKLATVIARFVTSSLTKLVKN